MTTGECQSAISALDRDRPALPPWEADAGPVRTAVDECRESMTEATTLYRKVVEWQANSRDASAPVSTLAKAQNMIAAYELKAVGAEVVARAALERVFEALVGTCSDESTRRFHDAQKLAAETTEALEKLGFAKGLAQGLAERHCERVRAAIAHAHQPDAERDRLHDARKRNAKRLAELGAPAAPKPATKPSVPQANRPPMTRLGILTSRDALEMEAQAANA